MIGKSALAFLLLISAASAETIADGGLGYSIDLPSGWTQIKSKPSQHYFRDGGKTYPSHISIVRYEIDAADYPSPESWTEAQFIAYKVSVETSVFPFGAIAFFDSSSKSVLGDLWAPEAYTVLYPGDGDPTYCEYIRYCARGGVGYEIYAIGDSADMERNVETYAGIIATIRISPTTGIAFPGPGKNRKNGAAAGMAIFDLSGRKIPAGEAPMGIRPSAARFRISRPAR